jgi:alpha-tubulin suppressor-like RCC1 family protein
MKRLFIPLGAVLLAASFARPALAQAFVQVSVGGFHVCALRNDGTAQCWGDNSRSQLGGSDTGIAQVVPRTVLGLPNSTRLASGYQHACALTQQVGVFCWGSNSAGQIGYAPSASYTSPTPLPTAGLLGVGGVDVGSGFSHSCMLKDTGEVLCWGNNSYGEHGDATITGYAPSLAIGIASATAIAVGGNHNCAILFNGTVKCWGRNDVGQTGTSSASTTPVSTPALVSSLSGVTSIAAGRQHTCAVSAGQVRCWGSASDGRLGGTSITTSIPTLVPGISDAVAVMAGDRHTCARLAGGTMKCWGDNSYGAVGDGFPPGGGGVTAPTMVVGLSGVTDASAGSNATCAVAGGYVRCWGDNSNGNIGNNARMLAATPVRAGAISDAVEIAASQFTLCARHAGGTVSCWGDNYYGEATGTTLPGVGWPQPVAGISNAVSVAGGEYHFCVALATGAVQCWGNNNYLQLGTNAVGQSNVPITVPNISTAVAVTAGYRHSCALLSGGGIRCWGNGNTGQLGNGASGGSYMSATPVDVINLGGAATAIGGGGNHTCALVGGQVRCWGDNSSYQLGNETTTATSQPTTALNMSNATRLSVGREHSCVITGASRVACWGSNTYNKALMFLPGNFVWSPTVSNNLGDRVAVAAGYNHTCAATPDGYVNCVGSNSSGALGIGTTVSSSTSTWWYRVLGLTGVTALAAGREFSCALRTDRSVWCWGGNYNGELGDGRGVQMVTTPQTVMSGICSLDLDDDGRVNATTDGVQLTRALLGFTGSAAVQGVLGSGARRTSAAAIREHLRVNCGLSTVAP